MSAPEPAITPEQRQVMLTTIGGERYASRANRATPGSRHAGMATVWADYPVSGRSQFPSPLLLADLKTAHGGRRRCCHVWVDGPTRARRCTACCAPGVPGGLPVTRPGGSAVLDFYLCLMYGIAVISRKTISLLYSQDAPDAELIGSS
jgi:hypothetical protein